MHDAKKTVPKIIIFGFLALFPFGQILRFNLNLFGLAITIQPIDVVAGLAFIYVLLNKIRLPLIKNEIFSFLIVLFFSNLVASSIFNFREVFTGFFYFLRLVFYASLFLITYHLVNENQKLKELLFNSLLTVLVFVGIFGWIQYFIYPDIRSFTVWGWDDHLYRIFGTFLDPGFVSILLVFGFLLSLEKFLQVKKKILLLLLSFFLITLAFTYSRAGYIALITGTLILLLLKKQVRWVVALILGLAGTIFLLPRPASSGVELERTFSIVSRVQNYQETLQIWQRSPLFGVGYNNLCSARIKYLGMGDYLSHSCSGSDSSLLGLLAMSGILGLISFVYLFKKVIQNLNYRSFGTGSLSCLVALLTHSLFVNSLFYSWAMAFMGLLLAISLTTRSKEKT